jgi:hypothetical protein
LRLEGEAGSVERMPKGGPIFRVNIRLGNEAGGTCNLRDTSYGSNMSIMSFLSDTNDTNLVRLGWINLGYFRLG